MKTALITGVTGQDGSYLAELLLDKGYRVIGISRRVSVDTGERIKHLLSNHNFIYKEGDICDPFCIGNLLREYKIDELYNLAAQSHVKTSFDQPVLTTEINYSGVLNILNLVTQVSPKTKVYQASTSEMFGSCYDEAYLAKYQDENTRMEPQSPYAIAKLAAHHAVRLYRDSYGIFACSGILFNHESPRRGGQFVTQKIIKWLKDFNVWRSSFDVQFSNVVFNENDIIAKNLEGDEVLSIFPKLRLGNLDASRDWGLASDYVEAMYLMLQQQTPDDYVIATGDTHTVREFLDEAFLLLNIEDWSNYVVVDPKFYRPAEVDYLCGCADKAKRDLKWEPKHTFKDLVRIMYET